MHHSEIPVAQSLQEQFKQAVINQDIHAIQKFLAATAGDMLPLDINALCFAQDDDCCSALMYASKHGHSEIVKLLLAANAEVNHADKYGWTALIYASEYRQTEIVKLLIAANADVDKAAKAGWTALICASEYGETEIVKLLLEANAEINIANKDGNTALIWASRHGHLESVRALLEKDAEINIANKDGYTVLMCASRHGHLEIVRALLEKDAEVDKANEDGWTALMVASKHGQTEIVNYLIALGADVNKVNEYDDTALMVASEHGQTEIVKALIEAKADVNKVDAHGRTALMTASEHGQTEIVKLLLEAKAEVNHANKGGITALMTASEHGQTEIVKLLLEAKAEVNHANKSGRTALTVASAYGETETVNYLIAVGADVNKACNQGWTALIEAAVHGDTFTEAAAQGHTETVKLLIAAGVSVNNDTEKTLLNKIYKICDEFFDDEKAVNRAEQIRLLLSYGVKSGDIENDSGIELETKEIIKDIRKSIPWLVTIQEYQSRDITVDNEMAEAKTEEGYTSLMAVVERGDIDLIKSLLSQGAPINAKDTVHRTALMLACQKGNKEIVQCLLDCGADVHVCDGLGRSLLAWTDDIDIIKVLLIRGLEPTGKERLPKDIARHSDVARILISKGVKIESHLNKDTKLISHYMHIIQQSTEVLDQDMNYLEWQMIWGEYNKQSGKQVYLDISEFCYMVHGEKVVKAMRLAPSKHPEIYARLVEARLCLSRGALADAAEALCGSQPVDDLSKQYRAEIVEELLPLLLCDQAFLQEHQKFLALAELYVQSMIKSTTDACITALLQVLDEHIAQQKSMQQLSSDQTAQETSTILESIKTLAFSIEAFDASSQHLRMKEKLPRDVALTFLKGYLGRVSDTSTFDQDLRNRLITLELIQGLSAVTMFGGGASNEGMVANISGSKRAGDNDANDPYQNSKEARIS